MTTTTQKTVGSIIVTRTSGNYRGTVEFQAWEKDSPDPKRGLFHNHSSVTSGTSGIVEGSEHWYGTVGSRSVPADLERLQGQERSDRVRAWQSEKYEAAYAAIIEAYPEAAQGCRDSGRIQLREARV